MSTLFKVSVFIALVMPLGPALSDATGERFGQMSVSAAESAVGVCAFTKASGTERKGRVLCYKGVITKISAAEFLSLADAPFDTLVVDSSGGDVRSGIRIANRILDHNADVVVVNTCLSSCANFILLSGRMKIISPTALVGWHGTIPKASSVVLNETGQKNFDDTLAEQKELFRRLGLKEELLYERAPGIKRDVPPNLKGFWVWSPLDLQERFGVEHIFNSWVPFSQDP